MTFFLIAGGCLLLLVLAVMIADNHRFVIRKYAVDSSGAGEKLTFVFLTDLHARKYGRDNEKLLQAIDRIHPDAVLVGGDMIIAAKAKEVCAASAKEKTPGWMKTPLSLLTHLAAEYPIYYVNGNHELKLHWHKELCGDVYEQLMGAIEKLGVICLHNSSTVWPRNSAEVRDEVNKKKDLNYPETASAKRQTTAESRDALRDALREQKISDGQNTGENTIRFYGLELDYPFYRKFHKETLTAEEIERHIGKPDPHAFTILITHNPRYFESYAAWGVDLVLCGHVHGGIARLPLLGGVISPYITLFPRYSGGRYVLTKKDGSPCVMILSCGLGMHTLPVRVFNPAELSVIELQ